tara:strand:+ start:329 stop:631 length:303 start_codon:yes stop_codon:yes gene_type:complete
MAFINAEKEHKIHYNELEWFFQILHETMRNQRRGSIPFSFEGYVTDEVATAIKDLHKWLKIRDEYLKSSIELTIKPFPEWYMDRHKKSLIKKTMLDTAEF